MAYTHINVHVCHMTGLLLAGWWAVGGCARCVEQATAAGVSATRRRRCRAPHRATRAETATPRPSRTRASSCAGARASSARCPAPTTPSASAGRTEPTCTRRVANRCTAQATTPTHTRTPNAPGPPRMTRRNARAIQLPTPLLTSASRTARVHGLLLDLVRVFVSTYRTV